jgi:hypothetical protein
MTGGRSNRRDKSSTQADRAAKKKAAQPGRQWDRWVGV